MSQSSVQPLVSIAIPTCNRSGLLRRSLGSFLAQTHRDFEVIISDNGSTDDTPAVVEVFAKDDPRIVSWRSPMRCSSRRGGRRSPSE